MKKLNRKLIRGTNWALAGLLSLLCQATLPPSQTLFLYFTLPPPLPSRRPLQERSAFQFLEKRAKICLTML